MPLKPTYPLFMRALLSSKYLRSFVFIAAMLSVTFILASEHDATHENTEVVADTHSEEHGEHGGGHGSNAPLFFIITSLLVGAAVRHFFRKVPLPFTVLLLLIGLVTGAANRHGVFGKYNLGGMHLDFSFFSEAFEFAANIDPHMLLFVFLPVLIFEAAFAMDVHTFKKSVANAVLLAVPGIIIALLLTGAMCMGLVEWGFLGGWTWPMSLMFGAVISATDPVAVVALLKELGASKKLGTLIEGESLLNDGTAIVIFMVFFTGITGATGGLHPVLQFGYVAFGGTLLGLIIAAICILWVKKVFNDPLVEISVIVAGAFITFFVAEHFLHVSGVLGLVALGLAMASIGRTRISPEIGHFLHEFWELAAFMANTLIFLIVGMVVAQRINFTSDDFIVLIVIYVGIHIVRAIVIAVLFPFMKRLGYGLTKPDAIVSWYGGLRGAIGLALALIVANEPSIDQGIRDDFLFITAGIVTLTLLVNATTIKFLVKWLGILDVPPAKARMLRDARMYLRESTENHAEQLRSDRYMKRANWIAVADYLPDLPEDYDEEYEVATIAETRRRILEKEKSSYWKQFKEGSLGHIPVRNLSATIDDILDKGGDQSLAHRADLEEMLQTPRMMAKLQKTKMFGKIAERTFFERLARSYDTAIGFLNAQNDCMELVASMERQHISGQDESLKICEGEINENIIQAQTFLRNFRNTYPEIYKAISTRQAIRSTLNYEMHSVERLQKKGQIDGGEAEKMRASIEARMKQLLDKPPTVKMPSTTKLLRSVKWLQEIEDNTSTRMVKLLQTKLFAIGDRVIKANEKGQGLYFVARGSAKVVVEDKVVDIIGPGSVIGEISTLTGAKTVAAVTAESPLQTLWISADNLKKMMYESKALESKLWTIAGMRLAENFMIQDGKMQKSEMELALKSGELVYGTGQDVEIAGKLAILIHGTAMVGSSKIEPGVIKDQSTCKLHNGSRMFVV